MNDNVEHSSLTDLMDSVDKVRIYGNNKHSGKELSEDINIYIAKAMRHLSKVLDGEYIDEDSGLPHSAHVGCNLVIIDDLVKDKKTDEMSERYSQCIAEATKGSVEEILKFKENKKQNRDNKTQTPEEFFTKNILSKQPKKSNKNISNMSKKNKGFT